MPLLNDMARCQGVKKIDENRATGMRFEWQCTKRAKCARYVERHTGSDSTPYFEYLCSQNDDSYIPAEKPNDALKKTWLLDSINSRHGKRGRQRSARHDVVGVKAGDCEDGGVGERWKVVFLC